MMNPYITPRGDVCAVCGCPTPAARTRTWPGTSGPTAGRGGAGAWQPGFAGQYPGGWAGFGGGFGPMGGYAPFFAGMPTPGFFPTGWGFGGAPGWMGTFAPGWAGFAPTFAGPRGGASDEQLKEMIFETIDADPAIPYDTDINVEVTGGIVTLTGTVPNKRVKHAVGDDTWWLPDVIDVNNQLEVVSRRARPREEGEAARPVRPGMRA
ncbi:MAG: BON domain-containing protein [Chloroflexi bacterium]|nr:BON domain-containing protein [Chloroflexota bacterium]